MPAKLSPGLGVVLLLVIATSFGANHVAARVAFDHGASIETAVVVRSAGTALVLLGLLWVQRVPLQIPRASVPRALGAGILVALQSYCLYSAVARIPVALALLAFHTSPMLFVLLSWATGHEPVRRSALCAMPLALLGLALALNVLGEGGDMAGRWAEIGAGVGWAIGAAFGFALTLFMNAHGLKGLDGRIRTLAMMTVACAVMLAGGVAARALALPVDGAGWFGLALLTFFYGAAITSLFVALPRLGGASSTVALNFEPIAVLVLAWMLLGQAVTPTQIVGALVVVGAIAWLGAAQR